MGYSNHYLIGAAYKGKVKVVPVHAMNAYSRSGGIGPLILNFNIRWRSVSLICQLLTPRAGLDTSERRRISFPYQDSNPEISSP